jgi:hypothetical protein
MKTLVRQFCIAAAVATIVTGCCTTRHDSACCEYKVISLNVYDEAATKQLNELVGQGWTLVSFSTSGQGENTVPRGVLVLKRHKKP